MVDICFNRTKNFRNDEMNFGACLFFTKFLFTGKNLLFLKQNANKEFIKNYKRNFHSINHSKNGASAVAWPQGLV